MTHEPTSKPIYEIFNHQLDGPDLLFMGPTDQCMCGCDVFHALIWFNEEREIAGYFTEGCCANCGALVRLATQDPTEMSPRRTA